MHVNFQFHDCNEYANDLNTLEFFRLVVDSAHAFTLSSTLFYFAVTVSIKCNRNIFLKMHYGLGRERERACGLESPVFLTEFCKKTSFNVKFNQKINVKPLFLLRFRHSLEFLIIDYFFDHVKFLRLFEILIFFIGFEETAWVWNESQQIHMEIVH